MNHTELFKALDAGKFENVYFFYGEEILVRRKAIKKLEDKLLMQGLEDMNRTVLIKPDLTQIMESAETVPLMSDYRLVIVRELPMLAPPKEKTGEKKPQTKEEIKREMEQVEALLDYLKRVPQSTCLIFEADKVDAKKRLVKALSSLPGAVNFAPLREDELFKWITQQLRPLEKKMSRETCQQLVFASGNDLTQLCNELAKLAAYVGEREQITAEDVAAIATRTADYNVFQMIEALADGKIDQAFSRLSALLEEGQSRYGIVALITIQFRRMMYAQDMLNRRMTNGEIAAAVGVPGFVVDRLRRQTRGYTNEQLRACVALCIGTDYDIKRGAMRDDAALERLMLMLAQARQ